MQRLNKARVGLQSFWPCLPGTMVVTDNTHRQLSYRYLNHTSRYLYKVPHLIIQASIFAKGPVLLPLHSGPRAFHPQMPVSTHKPNPWR